jgi:protein arginine kinase activator
VSEKTCEICGKAPAAVRFTEIDADRVTRRRLCRACAASRGLLDEPPQPLVVVQQLLAKAIPKSAAPDSAPAPEVTCRSCGLTFEAFGQRGRLGCPGCYDAFAPQLVPLLRKIHTQAQHIGKAPHGHSQTAEFRRRIEDLRAELERAVRGEDYERAAELRDEIRAVERQQSLAAHQTVDPEASEGPA